MSENAIKSSNIKNSFSTRSSLTDFSIHEQQYPSSKHSHSRSFQQTLILPSLDRKFAHKKVSSTQPNVNMKEALKDWLVGKQDVVIEEFIKKQNPSGIFYATPLSVNSSKKHLNTSLSSGFNIKQNDNKLEKLLKNMTNSMSLANSSNSSVHGDEYGDNIIQNNNIFSKNQGNSLSSANLVKRRIYSTSQLQSSIDTTDTHSTLDTSAAQHSMTSFPATITATMINSQEKNPQEVTDILSLQEIREAGRKATRKLFKKTSLDIFKDSGIKNEGSNNKQTVQESSSSAVTLNLSRQTSEVVLPQKVILEQFQPINLAIKKANLGKMEAQTTQPKDQLTTSISNSNEQTRINIVDTSNTTLTPLSQSSSISSQSSHKISSFSTKSIPNQQLTPQDQPKQLISSSFGILKQITLTSAHPYSQATFTEALQDYTKNNTINQQSSMINIPSATPQSDSQKSQARRSIITQSGNRIILDAVNHRKTSRGILKSKSTLQITKKTVNFNERVVQYEI